MSVKIIDKDGISTRGYITRVFPPCEYHSGRFQVHVEERGWQHNSEFWHSDFGKSVKECK